jgi:hypothetical protein
MQRLEEFYPRFLEHSEGEIYK